MDHAYITENGLIERYHRGLLPPEEEAAFEEHFVTCADCMEQLELARGFQKGLKAAVAADAAQAVLARAGLFAWLARRGRLAQLGFAVVFLSLLSLASLLSFRSLESQRLASAKLEAERRDSEELRKRLAESERLRTEERRALEGRLAEAGRTAPPEPPRGLPGPLVNTPVFLLTALRGEGEPAVVDRSQAGDVLALAVDVGAEPFESYRVTITREGGTVFRKDGLRPNALEALMITFPSSFFSPGEHRLRVEGVRPGGEAEEIGGYPFRVR